MRPGAATVHAVVDEPPTQRGDVLKRRWRLATHVTRRVAIAVGGSILAPREGDPAYLAGLADALVDWSGHARLLVCTGGGSPARQAIGAARAAGAAEEDLDRIGVAATRLNAQTLLAVLHARRADAPDEVPTTVEGALGLAATRSIVVMGGTTPGHSTDYVAAELAVQAGAERIVIATSVDGVYTRDPGEHPDADRKERLTFDELLQIVEEKEWTTAGAPGVIDGPATLLIATHGVPTAVVHAKDLDAVGAAVAGQDFHGTFISGEKVVLP